MEALGLLLHGFEVLLTFKILSLMMVGLVLGIFVGVLPGLGGPNGVAILLPLTFTMDPTSAIVMLSRPFRKDVSSFNSNDCVTLSVRITVRPGAT